MQQLLYSSIHISSMRQATLLRDTLVRHSYNAKLVKRLIIGEGSSTDVQDWQTPEDAPNILAACEYVEHVELGHLGNIATDFLFHNLVNSTHLVSLSVSGRQLVAWPYQLSSLIVSDQTECQSVRCGHSFVDARKYRSDTK